MSWLPPGEDELSGVLLSGIVFEGPQLEEIARSESGDVTWAVATIAAFACRDLWTSNDRAPAPSEIYDATRVAIRVVRA